MKKFSFFNYSKEFESVKASANLMSKVAHETSWRDHEKLRDIRASLRTALDIIEREEEKECRTLTHLIEYHGADNPITLEYMSYLDSISYDKTLLEAKYSEALECVECKLIQYLEDVTFNLPDERIIALVEYHNKKYN